MLSSCTQYHTDKQLSQMFMSKAYLFYTYVGYTKAFSVF
jgi:hypothetical protein